MLYQWTIKAEKRLLDEVLYFPSVDHTPKELGDAALIIGLAVAIPCLFILLAWAVDRISLYSFLVVGLGLADLVGNNIIRTNLDAYLKDAERSSAKAPKHNFLVARRKTVHWYWMECQHYQRISVYIVICCLALFIATNQDAEIGLDIPSESAYWLILLAITLNESVMAKWRYIRHRRLSALGEQGGTSNCAQEVTVTRTVPDARDA